MGYHLEAVARIVSCRVQQRLSTRSESFLASKAHYRLVISLGEEEKTEDKQEKEEEAKSTRLLRKHGQT